MKREITYEKMLLRLAGLCAGSEQCSADMRGKALKAGLSASDADRIVEYLVGNRYVDDARFARAYASDKVRFCGWGRMKIRMGLRGKGVSDAEISDALAAIEASEYSEALAKALAAKARSLDLSDVKDRRSLYRHLASRGFESGLIVAAIREYIRHHKADDNQ